MQQFGRSLLSRIGRVLTPGRMRREAALSAPFPRAWADVLERRCAHYGRLPPEYRDRFRQQVQIFLSEKRLSGIEMPVADETRALVAASAVSLSVGWPGYTWDQLTEVLLYPDDFDRDYNFGGSYASGMAHQWGTVILSVPALSRSFDNAMDAYHVGFHEFGHLLDLAQARFDGIPSYLTDDAIRRWTRIVEDEEKRLHRGDSVLDPYASTGPVEFFATAVEAFFQTPGILAERHEELYEFLSTYFCQDPASWTRSKRQ